MNAQPKGHGAHGDHDHASPLETLVAALDPEAIGEKVVAPHREIRGNYKIGKHQLKTHKDVSEEVAKYVQHHFKGAYKGELDSDEAYATGHQILERAFEREGGYQHALNLAKQGKVGEILDAIARFYESQSQQRYITAQLHKAAEPGDLEAQAGLVKEVFNKHKKRLGEHDDLLAPEMFAQNYAQVVNEYLQGQRGIKETYGKKPKAHDPHAHH